MRSLLDTEEEEEESTAREITLSTASLLGIFFGLVLICGVFFGFGYSLGRGTEQGAQAASLRTGPAGSASESDDATTAANQQPATPAAQAQDHEPAKADVPVVVRHAKPDDADDASGEDAAPAPPKRVSQALVAAESAAQPKPSARIAPPVTVAAPPAPSAAPAPGTGTGKPMVQIAAVARQEDADVLVSALRQRGYGVVVRSEPQDKLLHVQVGPFADRTQATAIKQKLLSDGYNAIIKQ
jgi:DedD protein